jgi:hypothetical protein
VLPGFHLRNLYIFLQVKSTDDYEVKNGAIAYSLKKSNYDQLRQPSTMPQYLVLYTLPWCRSHWVRTESNSSRFCNSSYFLDLAGYPEANGNRSSKTVSVPVANRLTAMSLLRLYREAAQRWRVGT